MFELTSNWKVVVYFEFTPEAVLYFYYCYSSLLKITAILTINSHEPYRTIHIFQILEAIHLEIPIKTTKIVRGVKNLIKCLNQMFGFLFSKYQNIAVRTISKDHYAALQLEKDALT